VAIQAKAGCMENNQFLNVESFARWTNTMYRSLSLVCRWPDSFGFRLRVIALYILLWLVLADVLITKSFFFQNKIKFKIQNKIMSIEPKKTLSPKSRSKVQQFVYTLANGRQSHKSQRKPPKRL
jgi:hypothetical protein